MLSGVTIANPESEQDWTLDPLGNWTGLVERTNGGTTLNQTRGYGSSGSCQLADIDGSTAHVAHDASGNMTIVPKPGNSVAHYNLVYDAWNRLVEVKDGTLTVARYEYEC